MKKTLIFACAACAALLAAAAPVRTRPAHLAKPSGGIVEKPSDGPVFRILDTTGSLDTNRVEALTREIRYSALLPIEVVFGAAENGTCAFAAADRLVAADGVAAGVLVTDDDRLPMLLVSPDRRWAIMNVAPLKAGDPSPERYEARYSKAYWNAVARALGAGHSSYPGCVLVPFSTAADLDALAADRPCPEPFNKMLATGHALGLKTLSIATYRMACQQGWASAPDTPERRAIWEEERAGREKGPAKPLRISPPRKKQ
jgi:hypothetical protein